MIEVIHKTSPRSKHITIRIKSDGAIIVSRPKYCPKFLANQFVSKKKAWIQRQLKKQNTKPTLSESEIKTLRKQAKEYLPGRTRELAEKHELNIGRVTIRNQSTRWGSCSTHNNISLNCQLMRLPEELREYVILHELAHVKHKHHQKAFWDYLESICPRSKERDKKLKKYTLGRA